jgi:exodeoxyribonuclease III
MKISSWNIRQGGSQQRLPKILSAILNHNPDVCVLSEYTEGEKGHWLKEKLFQHGYLHSATSSPNDKTYGLILVSKHPISLHQTPDGPTEDSSRWLYVQVEGWNILGVHIPLKKSQTTFWQALNRFAVDKQDEKLIIIGDYNTGLPEDSEFTPFTHTKHLQLLIQSGYIDAWRSSYPVHTEYTWYSNMKNGFRIDHCFVPEKFKNYVQNCYYSHQEREAKVSDHSMLHVELINKG